MVSERRVKLFKPKKKEITTLKLTIVYTTFFIVLVISKEDSVHHILKSKCMCNVHEVIISPANIVWGVI